MVKEQKGPSSFIEWAIGTTTENAIRSINAAAAARNQPKPPHREVLRFRVSTDDETAEDTLCITYPRTSGERSRSIDDGVNVGSAAASDKKKNRSKKSPVAEMTSTKKVRFEENAPRKSSMKTKTKKQKQRRKEDRTTVVEEEVATSESEGEEGSGTDISSDATIVSPDPVQVSSVDESNNKKKKKKDKSKNKKRTKQRGDSGTSGSESESGHVVCNCSDCIQERRQERKKHGKNKASKKGARVTFVSSNDEDAEDSDSATDIEEIQSRQKKKSKDANKKDKSNKAGSNKKKKKKSKDSETDEANSSGPESDGNRGGPENGFQGQFNRGILKKGAYPEGTPYPSQRTPNYIEPVRAEVVLTERVVESPNDPPPNAYYDAEHNVMRVYHGPVWGTTSNQGLYPRKGSSRPLPVGMPHPSQNSYLAGFAQDHGQGQHGQGKNPGEENNNIMPVTQGMPMNTWPAMYPPPGFPPYDAAHFGGHPYWQQPSMPPFASGAAGDGPTRAPSSQDKDKAGASNVMPPGIAADKPATEDKPASNAGSQTNHWGTGSNGNGKGSSAKGGNDNWAGFGDDGNNSNQDNAWGSNNNCNNSWNGGGSNHNNNNNTGWGSQQNNSQNGGNGSTKGDNAWGESNTNNNNNTTGWGSSSWGNGRDNNITGWGNTSTSNDHNNGWGNGTGSTNNNNNDWGTSRNNGSNSGNANATSAWDNGNNERASSSSPVLGGFNLFNEPDDQKVQNWDDNGKKNNRNKQRGKGKHDGRNSNAGSNNDNQGGAFAVFSRKDDSVAGAGDNNIMPTVNMPGAYSWGDPSAAASTGGKADKW